MMNKHKDLTYNYNSVALYDGTIEDNYNYLIENDLRGLKTNFS